MTLGWRRIGTVSASSIRRCSSIGVVPERSRTVSRTASGSRNGLTDTDSTRLLGTSTGSSPALKVVYSRPSADTTPSILPPMPPPCRRTRSPTRNGRALSRTIPAIRLPSVCCAARPKTTAENEAPIAIAAIGTPAMRSASTIAASTVSSRITNPAVPAVAVSIRLKRIGSSPRTKSRASAQPMMISASTTNTCSTVVPV